MSLFPIDKSKKLYSYDVEELLRTYYLCCEPQNKNLRFGEWVYNFFVHDGKPWPELYYSNVTEAVIILGNNKDR